MRSLLFALILSGCSGSASARLELSNQSAPIELGILPDGTSLRLKMIATYIAEDVDPDTMNNTGMTSMIWLNPECGGDISGCNVEGFEQPAGGPRIQSYFDLSRPTEEVNAELDSQDNEITPGTYRYARIELCKSYGDHAEVAGAPTLLWRGPDMAEELPHTSNDCARTSLPFDPPLVLEDGDVVTVRLGYDLGRSIVAGQAPSNPSGCSNMIEGYTDAAGDPHCFRECVDTDTARNCMEFPDFAPTVERL